MRAVVIIGAACVGAVVLGGAQSGVARGQSAAVAANPPVTLTPDQDAYVDAANPNTPYGTAATLRVDASPVQRSYLRFNLASVTGTVTKATLRVWAETGQPTGYSVYGVADTTWVESGTAAIKYNNAPQLAPTATGSSGSVTAGSWTSVVVTPLVSTGQSVSFALTTTNSTALRMSSKETTTVANKPQLVVETTASSDTQAPTTPTGLTATRVDSTHTRLDWNASTDDVGVTGYSVYRDNGSAPATTVSGSTLTFTDAVAANSTHSYTVDAFDAAGNHSPKTGSVLPPDAPGCKTSTNGTAYLVTVCVTNPVDGQTVTNPQPVSATAVTTSLNGQPVLANATVVFCLDAAGVTCPDAGTGYLLSDYPTSGTTVYGFSLPSDHWLDGSHVLRARVEMSDGFSSPQPTPAVNLTFNNGTTPPVNGNTFTPTSGTSPGSGPLVVAAVGDGAGGESSETSVVNEIAGWNPNLVLYLGDVYEKGSPSEFFNYYGSGNSVFGRFRSITDPTIGNHEYSYDAQASGYFNYWDSNKHYYSFDAGGWHFISLDSTSQFAATSGWADQYTWLQQDLTAETAPCTLVYYHHPLYNIGPEGPTSRMSAIWSLLAARGGVLVLNGHDHDYQRWGTLDANGNIASNGATQIVVGTGGHGIQQAVTSDGRVAFSDFTVGHFGALKLSLSPTSANFSFITTDAQTRDTGTFQCNTAPPAPTLTLTPLDGNDSATGSTVFYKPSAASGSFSVAATAGGATAVQFPNVFTGSDGGTDTTDPFSRTYNWTTPVTPGSFSVTASNSAGTSPASQFTVTPDGAAPSTTMLCNFGSCAGSFSSTVSVSLVASDAGSGVQSTYYTLDGTDPTSSGTRTPYSTPFLVPSTTQIRFASIDKVGNQEAPQSQTVTISGGGGGGIAFVQQKAVAGTAVSLPVTLSAGSASGDALVAVVALAAGSSASVSGVADTAGGAGWTKGPVGFLSGFNSRVEIWYRLNAPAVTTVTVTLSASKAMTVNVSEWSGVATAAAVDISAQGSGASTTSASTPLPFTTLNAADLVIGAINYPAAATATLNAGPFNSLSSAASTSAHGTAAYAITTSTGSYQAAWTLSAVSGGYGSAILALKAGAGGGGSAPPAPSLGLTGDPTDYVSGTTVFYRQGASGSFTVTATAAGATSMQFPVVFGGDGLTDTSSPFSQTYNWTSGASVSGPFSVTAANGTGTSPSSQFTVTPDATAPTTTIACNGAACTGSYSSAVTVSLGSSDGGSGVASTYYTLDGSDPTSSGTRTLYSAPFLVSVTTPVRFASIDKVGNQEPPQSQTVTISGGGGGGIAFVQQKAVAGTAASLPVALDAPSVSGNTLVAVVALAAGSSASVSGVTDSASGTWTPGPIGFLSGFNSRVEVWYRLNAPSVTSVTVTLSVSKAMTVNVSEWSGVATAAAVDLSAHGSGATSTSASTPLPFTTLNATDLVIGAINYPAAATATLNAGPFNSLSSAASSSVHGTAAYTITTSTGSYQAAWTLSPASGGYGSAILALKAA